MVDGLLEVRQLFGIKRIKLANTSGVNPLPFKKENPFLDLPKRDCLMK
jgi:hypothetical protein